MYNLHFYSIFNGLAVSRPRQPQKMEISDEVGPVKFVYAFSIGPTHGD